MKKPKAQMTERLQLVVSPEIIQAVDDWRRRQRDLPNRSEAIRRLILKAIGKAK